MACSVRILYAVALCRQYEFRASQRYLIDSNEVRYAHARDMRDGQLNVYSHFCWN